MLDDKTVEDIVGYITDKLLTPALYMLSEDEVLGFVCFRDSSMPIQELRDLENDVRSAFGTDVDILDIREFDELDRFDVIRNAVPVYIADPTAALAFEGAMGADMHKLRLAHDSLVERRQKTNSYYTH